MYLRSDESTLYSYPICEGSCFGKGNGKKGEGGRGKKSPLCQTTSLSLWFFLIVFLRIYFETGVLGGLPWLHLS